MVTELSLDYETFSEVDIKTAGGAKYVRHESTRPLMLGWAFDDEPVNLWQPHLDPLPPELRDGLTDPHVSKWAFNAPFEMGITDFKMGGIVVPRPSWRCTMFLSHGLAFTGSLNAILKQVGFPENLWKNPEGTRLIRKFSMPQPPSRKIKYWDYRNAPEDWELFCDYCRQDVEVERALRRWLSQFDPISDDEWMNWLMDQDINDRGIPVDATLVKTAIGVVKYRKDQIYDWLKTTTGLGNPVSNQQLLPWLQQHGVPLTNMQAPTLDATIPQIEDPALRQVVQLKRYHSQTATTKWNAYDDKLCDDSTLKGMFITGGASRTLREASRGINLQNLKRPVIKDMDSVCDAIKRLDFSQYADMEVMNIMATTVRGGIAAPTGMKLAVSDLGSIESRVLGWVAGCTRIINTFAQGKDTYKDFATELFSVPYEEVTKQQRTFSKPPTLGCGYQLGAGGLVRYAGDMGVEMTDEEADHAVQTFRRAYPELKHLWYWLVDACISTIQTGQAWSGYKVTIYRDQYFMYIQLPSGRRLAYYQPDVIMSQIAWTDRVTGERKTMEKPSVSYMGINQFNKQWERITTHGGGLTENIVQAIARDILFYHMRLAANRGHDIRGHVHDEIITVCPESNAEEWLEHLRQIMCISPPWAHDLLLDAEGYTGRHYRKD
jgi:DNA polymerase